MNNPTANMTAALKSPAKSQIVMAEIVLKRKVFKGEQTQHDVYTNCYWIPVGNAWPELRINGYNQTVSIAACNSGSLNFFWDRKNLKFYVNSTGFPVVNEYTLTTYYRLANKSRWYDSDLYRPRLVSIPGVSMRVDPLFNTVSQTGGGGMTAANGDRWVEREGDNVDWQRGYVQFYFAADLP
jgi:hypothetical protein